MSTQNYFQPFKLKCNKIFFMKNLKHALMTMAIISFLSETPVFVNAQQRVSLNINSFKMGEKPVLGWSSWSFIRKNPTAKKMKEQALALHKSGLQQLGYIYINLDDFWYLGKDSVGPDVDQYGRWITDPSRFPPHGNTNGIKVVADYVHSLGLKFGIYLTPGISKQAVKKNTKIMGTQFTADDIAEPSKQESNYNFGGMVGINFSKPGAQAYINSIADMFASWGVDFIKFDGTGNDNAADVKAWYYAIRQSGRHMHLDVTQGSYTTAIALTLMKYADQWEFAPDIECYDCEKNDSSYPLTSYENIKNRFNYVAEWQPYAGPCGYNDYDAIEIGNGNNNGITKDERKTQLSLWALGASPLILGTDLTHLDKWETEEYLKNKEVLAVDQDGIAAKRFVDTKTEQVFAKMESNGDVIVGLFNISDETQEISIRATSLGIPENKNGYSIYNLWTGKNGECMSDISVVVPAHGVTLFRVKGI